MHYMILKKICKYSKMTIVEFFAKWRDYSLRFATYNLIWALSTYARVSKVRSWADLKKRGYIFSYLEDNHGDIIDKYRHHAASDQWVEESSIWLFWAQGLECAPELVRMCCANLLNLHSDAKLLTLDNVLQYVDVEPYILQRVTAGTLSLTQLSDILRADILSKYGGVWIDATCFLTRRLPSWSREQQFFSPSPLGTQNSWCGWAMGTNMIGNPTFLFLRDTLHAHALSGRFLIDYLFIDYVILYAYENFDAVREMIDRCPTNNVKRYELQRLLNRAFDQTTFDALISEDWLFKLTHKHSSHRMRGGRLSYYGKLLSDTNL